MRNVVIVEASRTPIGRFRGSLSSVRGDHLGAHILNALLKRAGIGSGFVDDVVFGCVTQVGEQSGNVARTALLSAGWAESIPGMTVDRKCGSSETAVHVAAAQIASGACDVVVAGGIENMSRVPMGGNRDVHGDPFGWRLRERFEMVSQGEAAERLADRWKLTREDLDDYAFESHRRGAAACDSGYFEREIVPISLPAWAERRKDGDEQDAKADSILELRRDETIRRDTNRDKLGTLKSSFRSNGRVTAGNSSQISDGAAALLLMSEDAAAKFGIKPRAKLLSMVTVGSDPTLMLLGPIAASRKAAERARLTLGDIDLFEVNEAFASVPLVWMKETGISHERLNVNGGAIALGHPLGASGARVMTSLLHELERSDKRLGLQTFCCAGGLGTATIIERLE